MPKLRILAVTFLATLFYGRMAAQDGNAQQPFAGTWEAKFKDKVFFTIHLRAGERISGTVSTGHISVDDDGNLTGAEPSPSGKTSPILRANIADAKLSFETEDGVDDILRFEMTVTGNGQAELRFVGAPVRMKPILFKRK